MKHRLQMTLGIVLLLLSLALAARGAGSVGAATMPTFALPPMAHFQLDASLEMDDRETTTRMRMTASGQGDYDRARKASQFAAELFVKGTEAGVSQPQAERLSLAVVTVDGKTYWRYPVAGTWSWMANTPEMEGQLDFSLDPLDLTRLNGLNFVALRKETLGGATTTHWHADVDLAALLAAQGGGAVPSDPGMPLPQLAVAVDLWIGDDDGYLHRFDLALAMSAADASGSAMNLTAAFALTFSNFDQPVTIVAPAGAVPVSSAPTLSSPATAFTGALPAGVGSSLAALPFGNLGASLPGAGNTGGPRIPIGTGQPAESARPGGSPTPKAMPTPRPTPTPAQPTPTVARAANVVTAGGADAPASPAPVAQQVASTATAGAQSGNPALVIFGGAGLLLVLALGLVTFGWRMSRQ